MRKIAGSGRAPTENEGTLSKARTLAIAGCVGLTLFAVGCTGGGGATCGEGTTEVEGSCVADDVEQVSCGAGTSLEEGACVAHNDGPTCGDDTELVEGECVPVDTLAPCGAGTVREEGECVPVDTLAECGAGTVLMGSACVPEREFLDCGPGTIASEGECVSEPIDVTALRITQLTLDSGNAATPRTIAANHPVTVTLGVEIEAEEEQPAELQVIVALRDVAAGVDCPLGSFFLTQFKNGAPATYQSEFIVVPSCLRTSNEDDAPLSTRTMSPVVYLDASAVLTFPDRSLEDPIVFSPDNADGAHTTDCELDPADPGTSCHAELTVQESPGLDVELVSGSLQSPLVTIPVCDEAAEEAAGVPEAYRCNGSIVQREDGGYMYGPPDIPLEYTVRALGVALPDFTIDADGNVVRDDVNLLEDSEMEIAFHFRPTDLTGLTEDRWQPLYLHSEGDPAKADADTVQASVEQRFFETDLKPLEARAYQHGLYVEDDCGENNLGTCDPTVAPRTLVLEGEWAGQSAFDLRVCAQPAAGFETGSAVVDDVAENNCWFGQFFLGVEDVTTSTADAFGADDPDASSWSDGINYFYQKGDWSAARVNAGIDGTLSFSTSGMSCDANGRVSVDSKYLPTIRVVKGWAEAGIFTTAVGTYYDYGLEVFNVKLFGQTAAAEIVLGAAPVSFAKRYEISKTFWEFIIPLTIYGGIEGDLGVSVGLVAVGKCNSTVVSCGSQRQMSTFERDLFPPVSGSPFERIGALRATVKPYGVATGFIGVGLNLIGVRAGVEGQVDLLNVSFPVSAGLYWGVSNSARYKIAAIGEADMNIRTLDGRISLFVDHLVWVDIFTVGWRRWSTYPLFSWSGWAYNLPFYATNKKIFLN